MSYQSPAPYQSPYPTGPRAGVIQPAPARDPQDGVGRWMLSILLSLIPVIGFFYLAFLALSPGASYSKKNWARASFAIILLTIVVGLLLSVATGFSIMAFVSEISE